MSWFWQKKPSVTEKKQSIELQESTKERVEAHIDACRKSKNELLDKRDSLSKLINSTINQTYFVPSEWWYKEYIYLNQIRILPQNSYLSEEILNKCDELIITFENELNIINIQIEHYDFLIESYSKTLAALNSSKYKFTKMVSELEKLRQLDNIDFSLNKSKDNNTELLANEILQEENLTQIQQEISDLQKNLMLFEEYINQLKLLR